MADDPRQSPGPKIGKIGDSPRSTGGVDLPSVESTPTPEPSSESPSTHVDSFNGDSRLGRFQQQIKKHEAMSWLYQALRLPGTQRIIHDRRDEGPRRESRGSDKETHRGDRSEEHRRVPVEAKQEGGRSPADSASAKPRPATAEGAHKQESLSGKGPAWMQSGMRPNADQLNRLLSLFETLLIERFEEGTVLAQLLKGDHPELAKKTAKEWGEFFARFSDRSVWRTMDPSAIQALLFRGATKQVNNAEMGVLVTDLMLQNGGLEKFVRLPMALTKLMDMAKLNPGTILGKEWMEQHIPKALLKYVAIGPVTESDMALALKEAQGQYMSKRSESLASEVLGLSTPADTSDVAGEDVRSRHGESIDKRARRGRGLFGIFADFFGDDKDVIDDQSGQFIPWYSTQREKRLGVRRWWVSLWVVVIMVILMVGIWGVFRFFQS